MPAVEELTLQQRIDNSVEFLDEVEPGWLDKINLDELVIGTGKNCVCGQVFADRVTTGTGFG